MHIAHTNSVLVYIVNIIILTVEVRQPK